MVRVKWFDWNLEERVLAELRVSVTLPFNNTPMQGAVSVLCISMPLDILEPSMKPYDLPEPSIVLCWRLITKTFKSELHVATLQISSLRLVKINGQQPICLIFKNCNLCIRGTSGGW